MDFDFDPQQYEFRDVVARFLSATFPLSGHEHWSRLGAGAYDQAWQGLAELGLFSLLVPEADGGLGLTFIDLAMIIEELGRALAPMSITDTLIATDLLMRFGTKSQKRDHFSAIGAGGCRIAIAVLEPGGGYDPHRADTHVVRTAVSAHLSGTKILVPHAASASFILTTARLQDTGTMAAFLIPRDAPGVKISPHQTLDPSCAMAEISFDSVPVPDAQMLPGVLGRLFDTAAATAAGLQIGVAGAALDLAVHYAKTRVQFGRPIGSFQAIKHRCADMAVSHDGGRSAAYYGFWAIAQDAPGRSKAVSVAKACCGDAARVICNESIQIHGGMGFTWDLGLHHYLRRAKILEYSWGDIAFHRERALVEALADLGNADDTIADVQSAQSVPARREQVA